MSMIKIIGVDPGLAATGIGVVQGRGIRVANYSSGCIRTSKHEALAHRLAGIYDCLSEVLDAEQPDSMIVEDVFSLDRYPKSGITLGKVCGVILLAGQRAGVPVREIPVREAKQILTGNGNASKEQLEKAVRHLLKAAAPIRPFHASDALGLALVGLYRFDHDRRFAAGSKMHDS
jgi:crossover junction endodeoxyribonuclease RuvC